MMFDKNFLYVSENIRNTVLYVKGFFAQRAGCRTDGFQGPRRIGQEFPGRLPVPASCMASTS